MASTKPRSAELQKVADLDFGSIVMSTAKRVVKERPVAVSTWVLGLLLAAFATGFRVDEATADSYSMTLQHAQEVDQKEMHRAMANLQKAEDRYYNAKGYFWSCDSACQKAHDKQQMALAEVKRIQAKKDRIVVDARQEVGIWSTFGVKDVRESFWAAWKSGKDFAARCTMMDAMFLMMPGSREESAVSMILKIVMQYIVNLTMGLIGAFFFFIYNVYNLIVSYGESVISGLAFFLLVVVAAMSFVGTYLCAIYGTVAGGGIYLVKQAAKQAAMQDEARQRNPQRVQYSSSGRPGGYPGPGAHRSHYE